MNLIENLFELTNETLTFLENKRRWKTIHPKWNLELLAYLYKALLIYIYSFNPLMK
jgi:hypothetical protein